MTGSSGGRSATSVVGLDVGNPLEAVAEVIGEALGIAPEPGSTSSAAAPRAPQWQIEAGS